MSMSFKFLNILGLSLFNPVIQAKHNLVAAKLTALYARIFSYPDFHY